ncbi:MAG: hypothetical protein J6V98_01125, partial [Bacteroidales bacterium]|nr:hypothetical protein [Bacteroidales bacterium]
ERTKNDPGKGMERAVLTPAFPQLIDSRSSTVLQLFLEELLKNCRRTVVDESALVNIFGVSVIFSVFPLKKTRIATNCSWIN